MTTDAYFDWDQYYKEWLLPGKPHSYRGWMDVKRWFEGASGTEQKAFHVLRNVESKLRELGIGTHSILYQHSEALAEISLWVKATSLIGIALNYEISTNRFYTFRRSEVSEDTIDAIYFGNEEQASAYMVAAVTRWIENGIYTADFSIT